MKRELILLQQQIVCLKKDYDKEIKNIKDRLSACCDKEPDPDLHPPVVDAGDTVLVELPNNTCFLVGTVQNSDGYITSVEWSLVSGPTSVVIVNPNNLLTSVTGLTEEGVYVFKLKATNNFDLSGQDTVVVSVIPAVNLFMSYWGWSDSNIVEELSDITSLQKSQLFVTNNSIIADFRENMLPKYLIMAEPISEPEKTKWFITTFNKGNIGGTNNFFGTPIIVSGYRVYISNYKTQQTEDKIEFKIG